MYDDDMNPKDATYCDGGHGIESYNKRAIKCVSCGKIVVNADGTKRKPKSFHERNMESFNRRFHPENTESGGNGPLSQ